MVDPYDLLLFDLDGTLTDPIVGFTRSLNYALEHGGFAPVQPSVTAQYVGPPLDVAFRGLTGSSEDSLIRALVSKYRERYSDIGFAETTIYPGITSALEVLDAGGARMAVCTSKREDFAQRIVALLGLAERFRFVAGADIGISKSLQIAELRRVGNVTGRCVMIGDRGVDLVAAHDNGLAAGAVLWGYGSRSELEAESPEHVFDEPSGWMTLAQIAGLR